MGKQTNIQWCTATWNPWYGCHRVSPGCAYCYADREMSRYGRNFDWVTRASDPTFYSPLRWKEPQLIFTCSWSDFFIEEADGWRDKAWEVIADTPQHIYLVLTKRIDRPSEDLVPWEADARRDVFPNLCLMTTVENQRQADERIPQLLEIPARWHAVSVEPLLGPMSLSCLGLGWRVPQKLPPGQGLWKAGSMKGVDWVIVGGESGGPPYRSLVEKDPPAPEGYKILSRFYGPRGFDETGSQPEHQRMKGYWPKRNAKRWIRSLRDQCVKAKVPFLFKQWGGPKPTSGGRLLDGREWNEMPPEFAQIASQHSKRGES